MSSTARVEAFRPSSNHWAFRFGLFKERVTREQLRGVLLNQPDPIVRGVLCKWKNRHVGVGVYELWLEPEAER